MSEKLVEILLVEDNPDDVELIRAFSKYDIAKRIHVVRNGAEALDFIFCTGLYGDRKIENRPKVVLLDVNLPMVNGLEVLRRIRGDLRTQTIPVVMFTSSGDESDIIESYQLGVNSYVVKPGKFEQFNETVREIGIYWLLINQPPPVKV
jgi:two-component system response regulator